MELGMKNEYEDGRERVVTSKTRRKMVKAGWRTAESAAGHDGKIESPEWEMRIDVLLFFVMDLLHLS